MSVLKKKSRGRVHHRDCSWLPDVRERGRAKQEFKADTNINNIIAKYRRLGVWPSGSPGVFEDQASWPKDLAQAFELTANAVEQFNALPAAVRRRLGNDPTRLAELEEDDLRDIRAFYKRQAAAQPSADDGGDGGVPPVEEATPRKAKPAPKAKAEQADQE